MKSPNRPPLRPRNNRDMLLHDPSYAVKKEKDRRRQIRIQQAREKANEAAKVVRQRTEREKLRLFKKIGNEELQKFRQQKMQELTKLENEYQNALKDIGLGHEGVAEQLKFQKWKEQQAKLNEEVAHVRGEHALKAVHHERAIKIKSEEEKLNLRKSVKMAEDARAANIRSQKLKEADQDFTLSGKVIEVDLPNNQKKVRFTDQESVKVRRLGPLHEDSRPGVEAAIREEKDQKVLHENQRQMARMRGISALKRAQMMRRTITESFFDEDAADEIDLRPQKGPSSIVVDSSSDTSASSSLHANIIRLDPGKDFILHPEESSEKVAKGLVIGEAVALPKSRVGQKQDDEFIAKVLEGFQMPSEDEVAVTLQVEEVSTLQSSSTSVQTLQSTSSSMDITQEKFLSDNWKRQDIHGLISSMRHKKDDGGQLRGYIEKLLSMKREEIANLSVSSTMSSSLSSRPDSGSGFVSSTPASILTSSSSRSSASKSVRFKDALDGSYTQHDEQQREKRQEILQQTKVSLEQIQAYYEEQRQRIEQELMKRRSKGKENLSPLSEGPLTSSTSNSSPLQSSSSASREVKKAKSSTAFRRVRAVQLNKSSSSGTTTSGSVATIELLQRLRHLEMPSLERPPPLQTSEDFNTSADLMKASELDSSPILETVLHLSTSSTSS